MSYLQNNIPSQINFSAIGANILRIGGTTSTGNKFRTFFKALCKRAQKQSDNAMA